MTEYKEYRRDHPGPLSERSFQFWKNNGGEDLPTFKWTKNKKVKNNKKKPTKITKKNYHKNQP